MKINRNNYEEYFLLYADKELSADEKSMVERFIQQNPDLEEEFVILQQSVLHPEDSITLKDKSFLLRKVAVNETEFVNHTNYEEKFLLYTDHELSLSERKETEKFVLLNPALQNEFTVLQNVKYEPDTLIIFPDKRLLYKKEDEGKVIPFRWKALAAAVLFGIGLWTGVNYLQKENTVPVTVTKKNTELKANPVIPVEQKNNNQSIVKSGNHDQPLLKDNTAGDLFKKQPQKLLNKKLQQTKSEQEQLPEQKNKDVAILDAPGKIDVVKTNDLPHTDNTRALVDYTEIKFPSVQNSIYARATSYITDEEVKSENYVFYNITAEEFKKSKVGNFLKKVKRVVSSKIPFKNGLKIGSVEIAKDEEKLIIIK